MTQAHRYKSCKSCGESKSVEDFYRRKNGRLSWLCKPCTTTANNALKSEKRRLAREARAALPPETTKVCKKCGEVKSIEDDFHRRRKASEERVAVCKQCHHEHMQNHYAKPEVRKRRYESAAAYRNANRDKHRASGLKKYGITPAQYDELYKAQHTACAICSKSGAPLGTGEGTRYNVLCVDHDHITGVVRGLLCHRCNRAIGLLGDDPVVLRSAINYLKRTEENDA